MFSSHKLSVGAIVVGSDIVSSVVLVSRDNSGSVAWAKLLSFPFVLSLLNSLWRFYS